MNKKIIAYIIIGILSAIFVIIITTLFSGIFTDWELKTYDYRMRARGELSTSQDIILVDIDDRSIDAIGRWPWDRSWHAKMIDILTINNSKTIVYDILFNQSSDKINDELLVNSIKNSKRVLLPVGFDLVAAEQSSADNKSTDKSKASALRLQNKDEINVGAEHSSAEIKQSSALRLQQNADFLLVNRVISPMQELINVSKGLGHISSNRDEDGIIRRVPLVVNLDGSIFPSFALIAVMDFLHVSKENIIIEPRKIILKNAIVRSSAGSMNRTPTLSNQREDIIIPIDNKGMMLINYAGKWAETFNHYSFKNVVDVVAAEQSSAEFKNKIVIVSNSASGYDLKPIPVEKSYPGGGIHANIINTILTQNFLFEPSLQIKIFIVFILGIISALSGIISKWHNKIISILGLIVGYYIFNYYLFKSFGLVLDIIPSTMVCIMSFIAISLYETQAEKRSVISLTEENKVLNNDLEQVNKNLNEKEVEIIKIQQKLAIQLENAQLKEKLRKEKDLKEVLEEKKITIMKKMSPSQFEELRKEAESYKIITKNKKMLEAFELAKRVALTSHSVLIMGEIGTGKELLARSIHSMSKRNKQNFVRVSASNLVPMLAESELFGHEKGAFTGADKVKIGLFQEADNSTIFLDEIGELSPEIQPKLLRVLQEGEIRKVGSSNLIYVDARVITATDKDLRVEVENKKFNNALYSRINRYPIILPALRERTEDIPCLVDEFIKRHKGEKAIKGITKSATQELMSFEWKFNVRQLENIIIRAIVNTESMEIQCEDIKFSISQDSYEKAPESVNESINVQNNEKVSVNENNQLLLKLRETQFNIKETATILNLGRNTITDNFKGICFKFLAEYDSDVKKVALIIADNKPDIAEKLESKITEYYENLISHINQCENIETAKDKVKQVYKNIPKEYFKYIEVLIERYFQGKK